MTAMCNFGPQGAGGAGMEEQSAPASASAAVRGNPYSTPGDVDPTRDAFWTGTPIWKEEYVTDKGVKKPAGYYPVGGVELDYPRKLFAGERKPKESGNQTTVETPWGRLTVKRANTKVKWPVFSMESGERCSSRHRCPFSLDKIMKDKGLTAREVMSMSRSNNATINANKAAIAKECGVNLAALNKGTDEIAKARAMKKVGFGPIGVIKMLTGIPTNVNGHMVTRDVRLPYPDVTVCYAQAGEWGYPVVEANNLYQQQVMEAVLREADDEQLAQVARAVAAQVIRHADWWGDKKRFCRINDTGDVPGGKLLHRALEFLALLTAELSPAVVGKKAVRLYLYTKHSEEVIGALEAIGITVVVSQRDFVVVSDLAKLPEKDRDGKDPRICNGICHPTICAYCPEGHQAFIVAH